MLLNEGWPLVLPQANWVSTGIAGKTLNRGRTGLIPYPKVTEVTAEQVGDA
jgi:hypothetical protein